MLNGLDAKLFYLINKNCSNPVFDFAMPYISELGSAVLLFLVGFVLLIFSKNKEFKKHALILLAGIVITYVVSYFLKNLVARPRPFMVLSDVHLLIKGKHGASFPSHHAAQAVMAATILSRSYKKHIIFFSIAALVAFSRVYLGLHYVSDVVAGSLIGFAIGHGLIKAKAKFLG